MTVDRLTRLPLSTSYAAVLDSNEFVKVFFIVLEFEHKYMLSKYFTTALCPQSPLGL